MLVCGVHVLDGYETCRDVFEENAHTGAQSIFKSKPGRCAHRAGSKRPGSQTVTSFFSRGNIPVSSLTFLLDFCVSTTGRETTSTCSKQKKKTQHCCGTVGTSTRAIACALASKPQPLLLLHGNTSSTFKKSHTSTRHGQKTNRSFSSVAVSLIEEVTVEKQRSAPGYAALELQGSGAEHLQRSIASGTLCKRLHRFRTAAAIKLSVCNGKSSKAHLPRPTPTTSAAWWSCLVMMSGTNSKKKQQRINECVRLHSDC